MDLVNKCPTKSPEALAHLPDTDMQLGEANSKLIVINKLITITITITIFYYVADASSIGPHGNYSSCLYLILWRLRWH
ncbi:unnamed protein product [Prunus armeniaca]|uniref:Uncharacterized protein n=1 Tax=Prunus armeniaca TaxID=36596 RepID=A0A6J5WVJ5_PRUAR|nr:unnamed protein product [Prunus armeniaca]